MKDIYWYSCHSYQLYVIIYNSGFKKFLKKNTIGNIVNLYPMIHLTNLRF